MIHDNKIKMPRQESIEYYKLVQDANGRYSIDEFQNNFNK